MARPREWGRFDVVDFRSRLYHFAWYKMEGKRVKFKRVMLNPFGVYRPVEMAWPKKHDPEYVPHLDKAVRALHQDWRDWKFREDDYGK